jgi:hypothetical protein
MIKKKILLSVFSLLILMNFSAFAQEKAQEKDTKKIHMLELKMTTGIDDNLMPVDTTYVFPKGTSKVYCWFKWDNAEVNTKIIAKWFYETSKINILNYTFVIPRQEGSGSILLSMPKDKPFPAGVYRLDLTNGSQFIDSFTFKVE